jgi:PKD repeat protein
MISKCVIACLLVAVCAAARPLYAQSAPVWYGYAGNAQHTALSGVGAQPLDQILWQTPVDLMPQISGGDLLIHYGEVMATAANTIIVPVKTGVSEGFNIEGLNGSDGTVKWTQTSDFILPPHGGIWTPSFPATLTPQNRLYFAGLGGTVYYIDNPDASSATVTGQFAFFGMSNYTANKAFCDSNFFISSPLTSDSNGTIYFSFISTDNTTLGVVSGIARLKPDGSGTWVSAQSAGSNDSSITKPVYNCAPALSNDEKHLYVAVSNTTSLTGTGRLAMLDSTTLACSSSVVLLDPSGTHQPAYLPDYGTASPIVGPDGDVYFGVLENPFPANNDRGWLLHYSSDLSTSKTPGAFGWDDTPSIVPASMVPSYTGSSAYLMMSKYNNYAGIGTGDGKNKLAILDPNATQTDLVTSATVMKEILTILGVTPDGGNGEVREWCINTAVVDPATKSIYAGSEDGVLYQWDLTTNSFVRTVRLTPGIGEAYTPTLIGPDGTVYAINNAILFAVGPGAPLFTNGPATPQTTLGAAYTFTYTTGATPPPAYTVTSGALPDGLTLNSSTGVISGNSTKTGTYLGVITAANPDNSATQQFSITVNPLMQITPSTAADGNVGALYNFVTIVTQGTLPYAALSVSAFDAGPTGLAAPISVAATGHVAFNSTPTAAGVARFTVDATDAAGTTLSQPFITIINPALIVLPGGKVGIDYTQTLANSDGLPAGSYTFALANGSTLPPGLQLSNSGVLTGTPTNIATNTFTLLATDATPPASGGPFTFTLQYSATFVAPALVLTPATLPAGNVGAAYFVQLSTSGGTAPYAYAVSSGALPPGISLTSAGLLSGTLTTEGNYAFSLTATDSTTGTIPQTVTAIYTVPVDYVPGFASAPFATTLLAPDQITAAATFETGLVVQFSAVVTPADSLVSWNFGDGTNGSSGATVSHTYLSAGSYNVVVTATNPRTGSAASASLTLQVLNDSVLTGTSGFAMQSGIITLGPKINSIVLKSLIDLLQGEKIANASLTVDVNGMGRTVTLDAKGRAKSAGTTVHLGFKRSGGAIPAQQATLSVSMTGADLPARLKTGVATDVLGLPTKALLQFQLNGRTMTFITPLVFKRSGKSYVSHFGSK